MVIENAYKRVERNRLLNVEHMVWKKLKELENGFHRENRVYVRAIGGMIG